MKSRGRPPRSVLLLTHFYPPEPCAAANRVAALRLALIDAGFVVHVVTGVATFPTGVIAPGERVRRARTSGPPGALLTRVRTYASPVLSGRNRILNWLSVSVAMSLYVLTLRRRYDVIVVTLPPITLALPALCAKLRHRAKLVVDVRDVFPDVAIEMGVWRERSPIALAVGWTARALYTAAALVLCVTPSARAEIVARGSAEAATLVAPNGFDPFEIADAPPYVRGPEELLAVFVGNMGLATGLDVILDAAARLRDEPRIRFVLAGDGADRARLDRRIAAERLGNVVMLGVVARPAANALIRSADVCIVPLHRSLVDSLPTKLFDALVLGSAVVCCANGEARDFVERSGGGLVVAPEDGPALASALLSLLASPEQRARFAESGRAYVLRHYDRAAIMRDVAARLAGM